MPDHPPHGPDNRLQRQFRDHRRSWRDFRYVYPVISRRSRGLSIGINLNIDNACNFDCVYCCVDRRAAPSPPGGASAPAAVDVDQMRRELETMLDLYMGGELWQDDRLCDVPTEFRRLNDIAFSGNGEPTACLQFEPAVAAACQAKSQRGLHDVRIILITNATLLHRPAVSRALALLDTCQGQVWAKLDAGTDAYYRQVDRTSVPLGRVLDNIRACGRARPVVIQSLFCRIHGQPPPDQEFDAYLDRLEELRDGGCRISGVQIYTTARRTAESFVAPLSSAELDAMAQRFRMRLADLPVEVFYGA